MFTILDTFLPIFVSHFVNITIIHILGHVFGCFCVPFRENPKYKRAALWRPRDSFLNLDLTAGIGLLEILLVLLDL